MKKLIVLLFAICIVCACESEERPSAPPIVQLPGGNPNQNPINLPVSGPCDSGMVGEIYPCLGYDLIYRMPLTDFSAQSANDCWGWTDPDTGKEYAILGLNNGTAFIDISNPSEPEYLGKLQTNTSNSAWRDVKVYNNHAFIVSEASGHGMQVFDLKKLRNGASNSFDADAIYSNFGDAHNIAINTESGYAYAVGTSTFNGGPHFINIQSPTNPSPAGGYAMDAYSHDAQVVTYNGPDTDYTGREILIGSNETKVVLVDITDKSNPSSISSLAFDNIGYVHQGWFTEGQQYFLLGDELDELNFGFNSRTLIFDFTDLDNPRLLSEYSGSTGAIDHNGYVKGNLFYLANYAAGLREINLAGISSGDLSETGYFDTYPSNNLPAFSGAWSVYPYFDSGNIIISDISGGLFIVKR